MINNELKELFAYNNHVIEQDIRLKSFCELNKNNISIDKITLEMNNPYPIENSNPNNQIETNKKEPKEFFIDYVKNQASESNSKEQNLREKENEYLTKSIPSSIDFQSEEKSIQLSKPNHSSNKNLPKYQDGRQSLRKNYNSYIRYESASINNGTCAENTCKCMIF
jgi:hypothetical protein